METATFGACYARLDTGVLTIGNDLIERRWRVLADTPPTALSLVDKRSGAEWLQPERDADPPAVTPTGVSFHAEGGAHRVVGEPSLRVEVAGEGWAVRYEVFARSASVTVQRLTGAEAPSTGPAGPAAPTATGVEVDAGQGSPADGDRVDALERLPLAPFHLRLTAVELRDRTDVHNELVSEREWLLHPSEAPLRLAGCLWHAEDVLTGRGLAVLKLAPLPHARPEPADADLVVSARERTLDVLEPGDYPVAVICCENGAAGRTAALQRYQRCLRRFDPARDGLLLSNTWGDRNRDGRINEAFLLGEIEAGARLGVDVVQIDDGWQRGATSNSVRAQETGGGVWEGFWKADPQFWEPHPERFPHGLSPLVAAARERGMRFGLWFAPDSDGDFAHWERDADTLLRLHREHGIDYFKIDGVKMRTKTGERNLRAFFDRVLRESGGRVVFDCDVTAEVRPGYFGLPDPGPLFVENRYTDWHRYWPHHTLRNLWKLAQYIDPVRLRMEWLNHARNTEKYAGDSLAPAAYSPAALFATVMASSPLGWFEVQNLPESYFAEAAPLIAVWKEHREAFFSGTILPVGAAPDGVSRTGFLSVAPDEESGYLLFFRELSPRSLCTVEVPGIDYSPLVVKAEVIAGSGSFPYAEMPGMLMVDIPEPLGFVFARYTRA
jgi:alpha-galactosidase